MLEIVQAGQAGKTKLLFDMHRFRTRIFKEKMGWEVSITEDGLEVDQFDLPETIYLLSLDENRKVIGTWRFLPTTGPTMIRDVWPQFLDNFPMPKSPDVWETSRFAVDSPKGDSSEGLAQTNKAAGELLGGIVELCMQCGIREIYSMYDMRMMRFLRRMGCRPYKTSQQLKIGEFHAQVGVFRTDAELLASIKSASGIDYQIIGKDVELPQALRGHVLAMNMFMEEQHASTAA